MKKKCKVVMIATDKAENAILIAKYNRAEYHGKQYFTQMYLRDNGITSNHLYILSDDEIKEGDWYVLLPENKVKQSKVDLAIRSREWLKIIATTDSSLTNKISVDFGSSVGNTIYTIKLPSIPQSFIDRFISEYNKGNKIEEVIVEYEFRDFTGFKTPSDWYIKLNPDNTINISTIKDSWTREEVIELCKTAIIVGSHSSTFDFDEWIETNL